MSFIYKCMVSLPTNLLYLNFIILPVSDLHWLFSSIKGKPDHTSWVLIVSRLGQMLLRMPSEGLRWQLTLEPLTAANSLPRQASHNEVRPHCNQLSMIFTHAKVCKGLGFCMCWWANSSLSCPGLQTNRVITISEKNKIKQKVFLVTRISHIQRLQHLLPVYCILLGQSSKPIVQIPL